MTVIRSPIRPVIFSPIRTATTLYKGGGVVYEAEAAALFARMTTEPTAARKLLINDFWKTPGIKAIMAKMDAFYVTAAHDAQAARRNWVADAFNLAAVNSPTFEADRGYTGNGSSSYLGTGFVPSTAGGQMSQDSAHLGVWSRTNASTGSPPIGVRNGGSSRQTFLTLRNADLSVARINQDTAGTAIASTNSIGHFVGRRSGASASALFRNGASLGTQVEASSGLPQFEIVICALNTGGVVGNFNNYQIATAHFGANLTDADISALYSAINIYLTAVGAA